jgi:hypothetical protein
MTDAVLAVGRDCDCGMPMIWRDGAQRCAVYGSHPAPADPVHFRDHGAPGARLVDELTAMRRDASRFERARAARHLQAVV